MRWAVLCPDDWRLRWKYRRTVRQIKTRGLSRWLPFPVRRHG